MTAIIMRNTPTCGGMLSLSAVSPWVKTVSLAQLCLMEFPKQTPSAVMNTCKLTPREKFRRAARETALFAKGTLRANGLARTLVTSHWLEAIDSKHRYGSLLKKYFKRWLEEDTDQDFFFWLDHGEGQHCSIDVQKADKFITREDLENSRVKYCTPAERKQYATSVKGDRLVFAESGATVHTADGVWIFVMDPQGTLYVAPKQRGNFHHSSFLAGGPTLAAGRLTVDDGVITSLEAHSGHYRPERRHFEALLARLSEVGLDLSRVQVDWSILEHNKRKAT
eukprot:comp23462_c0_seq1/m.39187 comp23462_c0_seq1/g.39187  ORF comp23462_c0_seq1/g.39187 comp23462_c0_seq1/m.39187 type:complete len:280 (-) comp23462_c0_seq1:256-1095(-)